MFVSRASDTRMHMNMNAYTKSAYPIRISPWWWCGDDDEDDNSRGAADGVWFKKLLRAYI